MSHDAPTPLPVACTLSSPALADRRRAWQRLCERALRLREATPTGVRLVFAALGGVEVELRELVRLETDCCAFARWSVARHGDEVVLEVSAAGEGVAALRAMFSIGEDADRATAQAPAGG